MIKLYSNGNIYVGEMENGKKCGRGIFYCFDKNFKAYKCIGIWENDTLNGGAVIYGQKVVRVGNYKQGKKQGLHYKITSDYIAKENYNLGRLVGVKVTKNEKFFKTSFGACRAKDGEIYIGDIMKSETGGYAANGFGAIYFNAGKKAQVQMIGFFKDGALVSPLGRNDDACDPDPFV